MEPGWQHTGTGVHVVEDGERFEVKSSKYK